MKTVQPFIERGDRVVRSDGHLLLKEDLAAVELGHELVDRDGDVRFVVDQRPVHRRAAAVLGKRRVVHVDERASREQRGSQNAIVGRDHHAIRLQLGDEPLDAAHRDVVEYGDCRRRRDPRDEVAWIGPAHEPDDLAAVDERLQRGRSGRPLADEQHA